MTQMIITVQVEGQSKDFVVDYEELRDQLSKRVFVTFKAPVEIKQDSVIILKKMETR